MREILREHYWKIIKKTLKKRKLTLAQIVEKSGLKRSTTLNYLNIFVALGRVKEKFIGRRKYYYLSE